MSFISLPTGQLYEKPEKKELKNFLAGYVGKFHRNLADNVDPFLGSDFCGRITNDAEIPSEDVQKYIQATSDFAKGMQTDINHYVTKDRLNNARFRKKLDPISENILKRQNPRYCNLQRPRTGNMVKSEPSSGDTFFIKKIKNKDP